MYGKARACSADGQEISAGDEAGDLGWRRGRARRRDDSSVDGALGEVKARSERGEEGADLGEESAGGVNFERFLRIEG